MMLPPEPYKYQALLWQTIHTFLQISSCFLLPKPILPMAFLNQALLHPWLDSLHGLGWLNFWGHCLYALKHLREVAIRPDLLLALVHFWDPEVHVFRFGIQELCPTVEEFHAYLGSHDSEEPIVPMIRESMKKLSKPSWVLAAMLLIFLFRMVLSRSCVCSKCLAD